jgi:hypothetical protein
VRASFYSQSRQIARQASDTTRYERRISPEWRDNNKLRILGPEKEGGRSRVCMRKKTRMMEDALGSAKGGIWYLT